VRRIKTKLGKQDNYPNLMNEIINNVVKLKDAFRPFI